jgi:predicted  nucleic acid-binding Zn-ribbon protein
MVEDQQKVGLAAVQELLSQLVKAHRALQAEAFVTSSRVNELRTQLDRLDDIQKVTLETSMTIDVLRRDVSKMTSELDTINAKTNVVVDMIQRATQPRHRPPEDQSYKVRLPSKVQEMIEVFRDAKGTVRVVMWVCGIAGSIAGFLKLLDELK